MTEEEQALGRIYKTVTPAATQTVQSGAARKPAADAGKVVGSVSPAVQADAPIFDQEPSSSKNASVWMVLVTFAIIAIPTISVWIAVFAKQR